MTRNSQTLRRWGIAIVLGLGAATAAQAVDGRSVGNTEYEMAQWAAHEQAVESGLTRADVRNALRMARLLGLVSPDGEGTEPAELLAARDAFNALQTEVHAAQVLRPLADSPLVVD